MILGNLCQDPLFQHNAVTPFLRRPKRHRNLLAKLEAASCNFVMMGPCYPWLSMIVGMSLWLTGCTTAEGPQLGSSGDATTPDIIPIISSIVENTVLPQDEEEVQN